MDSYNHYGAHTHYTDKNVQNANRVYINPNFHRSNVPIPQNGMMYLNPQFHQNHNLQPTKPKIYINPNFVRTNSSISSVSNNFFTSGANNAISSTPAVNSHYGIPSESKARTNASILGCYHSSTSRSVSNNYYVNSSNTTLTSTINSLHLPNVTPNVLPQTTKQTVAVAKSRYSLVRQNNNTVNNIETPKTDKIVTKMKISKYKTVSLDHVKKHIDKDKQILKTLPQTNVAEKTKRIIRADFVKSRFKLIKNNMRTTVKIEYKTPMKRRYPPNSSKLLVGSTQKLKMKVEMTKFKKNNIPCSLFKKYGTCLRNTKGKCEFLHDKKHVSICRRFLKGICYDKNCLLSHEVTAEKMPTCSFYLKGMCTKEDCPYLHVKLNDKTKICLDFLKGYCEKGDKCLNRHVNICPDQAKKETCSRKRCSYLHRINKSVVVNKIKTRKLNQSMTLKLNMKIDKAKIAQKCVNLTSDIVENKDCRYYKEVIEDKNTEEMEVIKPTRCKLGTLPSFIQL